MSKYKKGRRSIPEKLIQDWLEEWFSSKGYTVKREVNTPVGKIDLILYQSYPEWHRRDEKILIETKEVKSIKHAIGQLQAYEKYHLDSTELWCIYFDRYGYKRSIDASYHLHKNIKFNDVMEIVSLNELYKYGEERGVWSLEEEKNYPMLKESSETMILTPMIGNEMETILDQLSF